MTAGRILLAVGLLTGVLARSPGTACACSCAVSEPTKLARSASAIIVGTPIAETADDAAARYRVRVTQSFKQRVPQEITVVTSQYTAGCGIDFRLGSATVITLGPEGNDPGGGVHVGANEWGAGLCSQLRMPAEEVGRYAGPALPPLPYAAAEPQPREDSTALRVGVAVGAVALGVAAIALTLRTIRRRG